MKLNGFTIEKLSFQEFPHPEHGTYKVYVFGKGVFVNNGDGGNKNIVVEGKYSGPSSGRYTFQER